MTDLINGNNSVAKRLREIWQDALQSREIYDNDVFLDLGGDSLAAMLCISRIRTAFGVELTIEDLFSDEATVSNLAMVIGTEQTNRSGGLATNNS